MPPAPHFGDRSPGFDAGEYATSHSSQCFAFPGCASAITDGPGVPVVSQYAAAAVPDGLLLGSASSA